MQQTLHAIEVEPIRVMGGVGLDLGQFRISLGEIVVVVQIAAVGVDAEEAGQVLRPQHFLRGHEYFKELFAVTRADGLHAEIGLLQFQNGLRQRLDSRGGGLLHKQVALLAVLEGVEDEIDRVAECHHEAGHVRIRDGERFFLADLVAEQGNDRAAGCHDIAVARQTQHGVVRQHLLRPGDDVLFHQSLGHAHGVDGVGGLVGGEEDRLFDPVFYAGVDDIVGADDIGLDCLHGKEFTGGHLLEGGGVEHIVDPAERRGDGAVVPYIADVEFDLFRAGGAGQLIGMAHVVLFFLVARKDADLPDIRGQKAVQNRMTEGAGAARDEEDFIFKQRHFSDTLQSIFCLGEGVRKMPFPQFF